MRNLRPNLSGAAEMLRTEKGVRLLVRRGSTRLYSNAQIDDYGGLPRSQFEHRPPLSLSLRARFSHEPGAPGMSGLQGTAGFGFWNDPFMMTDPRPPLPPRALWFFYASPPSDMKLDIGTPGRGWKAATIDALRPSAIAPALAAPLLVPLMNLPAIYRRAWPAIEERLHIAESQVRVRTTDWHSYGLEWGRSRVRFLVDDALVLDAPAPRGPLGLVIWCDNQYMIVKPWGRLGYGLLDTGEQWLEVEDIDIRNEDKRLQGDVR